jgi:hypothetical protein
MVQSSHSRLRAVDVYRSHARDCGCGETELCIRQIFLLDCNMVYSVRIVGD